MKDSQLTRTKINKLEFILALAFIVPYIEIGKIRDLIEYRRVGVLIPASIFIMFAIMMGLTIIAKFYSKKNYPYHIKKIIYLKIILDVLVLIRGLYIQNFEAYFVQFLWFVIPFYYAFTIIKFIYHFDLKINNVGKIGLLYFTSYLCFNIVMNFKKYGFSISGTVIQSRLISPGGGPVVLGYTIVLMMCYVLSIRNIITKKNRLLLTSILFLGAILTGSRGSIWPMIMLAFIYIITNKKSMIQILSAILIIIVIIIVNPISFLSNLVPRIMNLSGGGRAETVLNSIKIFHDQSILNIFFGLGLGGCFPYQLWITNGASVMNQISYNTFLFNGHVLLVQPHNTYIYVLLEMGLVGLMLFFTIFIKSLNILKKNSVYNKTYRYFLIIFIIILNCTDSVFIVQPGSAGLWWLLLFFAIDNDKDINKKILSK